MCVIACAAVATLHSEIEEPEDPSLGKDFNMRKYSAAKTNE
jgi:hypothetical protein